jgi:ketosteroid isomerase-like protein
MRFLLSFLCLISVHVANAQTSDKEKIMEVSRKFSADYVNRDFKSMANAYTEDAIILAPNRDIITGRDSIFAYWAKSNSKLVMHKTVPESLAISGNEAHDTGYYFVQTEENGALKPVYSAKYYIVWTKTKGEWKMKMDMWNSRDRNWTPEK